MYELEKINSQIIHNPFDHSTYKFISDDTCDKLINNIDQILDFLKPNELLNQSRFMINLFGNTNYGFDNKDFIKKIENIEPLYTIIKQYEKDIPTLLYKKYNCEYNCEYNQEKIINYCLMIVYDIKNYEIGPHTDSYNRNVTMVTYLGPIKNDDKLGLILYKDLINRHENEWKKIHYEFDNFEPIKQIEYYKGSTIDFKVSKKSFHGVPKIEKECDRYSLQFFIFN